MGKNDFHNTENWADVTVVEWEEHAHVDGDESKQAFKYVGLISAALPTGANFIGLVTVANTVTVDGSGVTQPVSGTVTANLSATDNAVLDTIDAVLDQIKIDTEAIETAVEGTLTVGSHDVTNAGTFATQIDAALPTGANFIGLATVTIGAGSAAGTEYTEDAAAPANPDGGVQMLIRQDTPATLVSTDGDNVARRGTNYGAAFSQIIDSSGNFVDTFGGGTQYAVDTAAGGTDTGTLALAVRDDTLSTLTPIDGDYTQLRVNSQGALHVTGGGGGTEYTQDAAHTDPATAATWLLPRDDALSTQETADGDWTLPRANARGAQWVELDQTNTINVTETNSAAILADTASMDTNLATIAGDTTSLDGKDLMLGTDFSNVLGTADLTTTATLADAVATTQDVLNVRNFNYVYNGTTFDFMREGGEAGSVLVDLGANNDVTVTSGTIDLGATDNAVLDAIDTNTDWGGLMPTASTDWKYADINDAVSGDNTIIAAQGASNKIAVWAIAVVSDGTVDVRFEDGAAGTAFTGQIPLQAREGFTHSAGGLVPLFVGTANTLLNLELTAAINVHGTVAYTVVT